MTSKYDKAIKERVVLALLGLRATYLDVITKANNWYSSSTCPNLTTIHCTNGNITL